MLVDLFVLLIQSVHQPHIDEYQDNEDVDRTLLGKPKSEFEATYSDGVELVNEQNAAAIRYYKPNA